MKAKLLTIICLCGLSFGGHDFGRVELDVEPVEVMTVSEFAGLINEAMLDIYMQGDL